MSAHENRNIKMEQLPFTHRIRMRAMTMTIVLLIYKVITALIIQVINLSKIINVYLYLNVNS